MSKVTKSLLYRKAKQGAFTNKRLALQFLNATLEHGDIPLFKSCLFEIIKARGSVSAFAESQQVTRMTIYNTLLEGNSLKMETLDGFLTALGFRLSVRKVS